MKKSWLVNIETGTRMAFTIMNGASFRLSRTTGGAFHLLSSSGDGDDVPDGAVWEYAGCGEYVGSGEYTGGASVRPDGSTVRGAVDARVLSVGIAPPPPSAAARADAFGKRSSGFFSRQIITARERSAGKSGHRSFTGTGCSDKCFTSMDGVFDATK